VRRQGVSGVRHHRCTDVSIWPISCAENSELLVLLVVHLWRPCAVYNDAVVVRSGLRDPRHDVVRLVQSAPKPSSTLPIGKRNQLAAWTNAVLLLLLLSQGLRLSQRQRLGVLLVLQLCLGLVGAGIAQVLALAQARALAQQQQQQQQGDARPRYVLVAIPQGGHNTGILGAVMAALLAVLYVFIGELKTANLILGVSTNFRVERGCGLLTTGH